MSRAEVVAEHDQVRLDRFLAESGVLPSRAVATRLAREGAVTVNGAPARASRSLKAGDQVVVDIPPPEPARPQAEAIDLDVVYEDPHLLVVNKPAGMVVHPGAGQARGTLVNALLARHLHWPTVGGPERPGIIHRLDKGTSGLILVARDDATHRRLSADLAERLVSRHYMAISRGVLKGEGLIDAPIGRDPRERKRMAVVENGRRAVTRFQVAEALRGATLLEVQLETGRTHQIRVHLASIGHPIVGDETYGGAAGAPISRPALHARRLRFRHPVSGEEIVVEADPPADFVAALEALR